MNINQQCEHGSGILHAKALFTLNHPSIITSRESTYAVNMNERMLPPTYISEGRGGKESFFFSEHCSKCLRISFASKVIKGSLIPKAALYTAAIL